MTSEVKATTKWAQESSSEEGSLEEEEIIQSSNATGSTANASVTAERKPSGAYSKGESGKDRGHNVGGRGPINIGDQRSLMVANLNYTCTDDEIYNFFTKGGCRVKHVRIGTNNRGAMGIAFIEFEDQDSTEKALTANGVTFLGRELRVEISNYKGEYKGQGGRDHRSGPGRPGRGYEGGRDRRDNRDAPPRRSNVDRPSTDQAEHNNTAAWDRKKPTPPPPVPQVDKQYADKVPDAPATRPKIDLLPRTLPLDVTLPVPKVESIFGSGKPREEVVATKKPDVVVPGVESTETMLVAEVSVTEVATDATAPTTAKASAPLESLVKDEESKPVEAVSTSDHPVSHRDISKGRGEGRAEGGRERRGEGRTGRGRERGGGGRSEGRSEGRTGRGDLRGVDGRGEGRGARGGEYRGGRGRSDSIDHRPKPHDALREGEHREERPRGGYGRAGAREGPRGERGGRGHGERTGKPEKSEKTVKDEGSAEVTVSKEEVHRDTEGRDSAVAADSNQQFASVALKRAIRADTAKIEKSAPATYASKVASKSAFADLAIDDDSD